MLSYEAERMTIGKLFHNAKKKRGRGYLATREERRYGINKYGIGESGNAGAKALIEVIKALDNWEFAAPTVIPTGAEDTLVNMAVGSPAICAFRFLKQC